jgi:hypothetical protein
MFRLIGIGLLAGALAWGAPQGKGKGKGSGGANNVSVGVSVYRISDPDIVIVKEYYHGRSLPPGLEKKLARGGSLPPGWQKKVQPVPVVLERRLAPLPSGYRRGIIDGAFVVYEPGGMIIDVVASFTF